MSQASQTKDEHMGHCKSTAVSTPHVGIGGTHGYCRAHLACKGRVSGVTYTVIWTQVPADCHVTCKPYALTKDAHRHMIVAKHQQQPLANHTAVAGPELPGRQLVSWQSVQRG